MAYADLLDNEGVQSQYLVVMKPRRILDSASWSNVTGNIYKQSFTLGEIVGMLDDGTALTQGSSTTVTSNQFYYDVDNSEIYVNVGANPNTSRMVGTYEIHLGTFDAFWYRDPTDDSTRTVYYEPLLESTPQVTNSASDVLFGFLPNFSASIGVSNATQFLQPHLYESSFNRAAIEIYHYLDELTIANIKLVLRGFTSSITSNDDTVSFNILDSSSFFDKEYRNPVGPSFYGSATFANLDPEFEGRPLRQVYGVVEGFRPVNISYNETPLTTNNRTWVCVANHSNLGNVSTTVPASPSSTSTRTYLTSADGFRVGDSFWNETLDDSAIITAVNKTGDHYIEHSTLVAASSGDTVSRSFVGKIEVLQDEIIDNILYGRDYINYTDATNKVAGFTLRDNFETDPDITMSALNPKSPIWCRIYGHTNQNTLGGSSFGSDSAVTGCLANPVVVLYELLKTALGLAEAELNTTSFSSLESSVSDEIGLAIPEFSNNLFPTYKELIIQISETLLLKLFPDDDLKWKIALTAPLGSVTKTIEDDEILEGSFNYDFEYADIVSFIRVLYNRREISEKGVTSEDAVSIETATSEVAEQLHQVVKQRSFRSLHYSSSDAATLASHLAYALGDRRGVCSLSTKNRFFDTTLDHVIRVSRSRVPGYSYVSGTDRTRDFAVNETTKSLSSIDLIIDDQKGIEDNQGSW